VKFSCERCGKKYATADAPAPGRVYKIKCRACGHLMVVKAAPEVVGAAIPAVPAEAPAPEPAAPLAAVPDPMPEAAAPLAAVRDPTPEPAAPLAAVRDPTPEPAAPVPEPTVRDATQELSTAGIAAATDQGARVAPPDPFAALGEELSALPASPAPPPEPPAPAAAAVPKIPFIPKPARQEKSALPLVLIGVGALLLAGILAFVLLGGAPGP
jgi:hypothetical protein